MNKKTISIVLGALLLGSFFLPYLNFAGFIKASAFDIIKEGGGGLQDVDKYLMLLTPLGGLLLLVGALRENRYVPPRPILGLFGLIGVLYPMIRMLIESKGEGFGQVVKILGLGFWIGLAASIAVLVYNPRD